MFVGFVNLHSWTHVTCCIYRARENSPSLLGREMKGMEEDMTRAELETILELLAKLVESTAKDAKDAGRSCENYTRRKDPIE